MGLGVLEFSKFENLSASLVICHHTSRLISLKVKLKILINLKVRFKVWNRHFINDGQNF